MNIKSMNKKSMKILKVVIENIVKFKDKRQSKKSKQK